jgi:hypothetical protein
MRVSKPVDLARRAKVRYTHYCTALSMYRSFAPQDQIDGPLLWRAWAEMEWEDGMAGRLGRTSGSTVAIEAEGCVSASQLILHVEPKALSMYRSFAPQDQIDGPLLWRAWAEMEWEDGRPNVFDASVTVPKRQVVSVIP